MRGCRDGVSYTRKNHIIDHITPIPPAMSSCTLTQELKESDISPARFTRSTELSLATQKIRLG